MKLHSLTFLLLMLASPFTWSYGGGGGGGTKACAKPKFSEFIPADKSEVDAESEFSFVASKNTYPESIEVKVKGQSVDVDVKQEKVGTYAVTGKLPETLKGTYARISISADAQGKCFGSGGWLVKIKE